MNLSTATEAELLALMATGEGGGSRARSAWEELYLRHRRYLYLVVRRCYGSFLGEDGVADLVIDTFRRAYEWALRQPDAAEVKTEFTAATPDATRRRVLGWLGRIAERLFRSRFREHATEAAKHDLFLADWSSREEVAEDPTDPASLAKLQQALATLGPADAEALKVSLPWYDPESGAFAVPRGEAARLAELLGITPETLRQRRHRALKKLGDRMQEAGSAEPTRKESP